MYAGTVDQLNPIEECDGGIGETVTVSNVSVVPRGNVSSFCDYVVVIVIVVFSIGIDVSFSDQSWIRIVN